MTYEDLDFDDIEEVTDEQIEALKEKLQALEEELTRALHSTDESSQRVELDQARMGRLSRIDAMQQQQMSKAYRRRTKVRLQQVRGALDSIKRGDYGICNACDMPIAYTRLQARPESPICMECQSEREQR